MPKELTELVRTMYHQTENINKERNNEKELKWNSGVEKHNNWSLNFIIGASQ